MESINVKMMGKGTIVSIGGGEIGRTKTFPDGRVVTYPVETLAIDQKAIELTGKTSPKLLFLGTATEDSQGYIDAVTNHFGKTLGCHVTALKLFDPGLSDDTIKEAILSADMIYTGGGDTKKMLDKWKEKKVDILLKEACEKGVVLAGLSAGAIALFEWYDNVDYIDDDLEKLDLLEGLGLLKGFAVPHYDTLSPELKTKLAELLKERGIDGWGMENSSAIISQPEGSYILSAKDGKTVFKI